MNFFERGSLKVAVLALVVGAAIAQMAAQSATEPPADASAEIASLRQSWVKHWNARELAPLMETYAPDAVLLPPNGETINGRAAITNYWKHVMGADTGTLSLQKISFGSSDDVAYENGQLTRSLPQSGPETAQVEASDLAGKTRRVQGSYLIVLRRQPDGTWRIVEHAFTEALLKSMVEDKQPKAKPVMPSPQER
ncbi:MAG TPA: DUF4440 domain-containing protein [Terriglobales bacterium]|nr:DUF4440 domain-containing protein [Terriglobales bacterium]